MPRRPSAVRMFNTPTTARGLDATKGVLPSGGKLDDSAKSKGRVVDSSVSHVDRHRIHLLRKPNDTSNMFVPLEPKAYDPSVSRGVNLHTDPFDEGRARITFKKAKAKVATPRGPERAERRHLRQCDLPKNEGAKDGFIVANGIRHTSPKRVYQERHSTTHQLEQPPKSFKNAQRFFFSPYKGGRPLVRQPGMFLPENSVEAPAALKESKESPASLPITASTQSGARTYRALSNAFFDTSAPPPPAVEDRRRAGVRQFAAVTQAPTMEGVFTPMRDGRVPRPQAAEAPWTRMEQQPHPHGVRMLSARQAGEVPYAIEW